MADAITKSLRDHMDRLQVLRSEHNRQRNCSSRGYDEDGALSEMQRLEDSIEAEMDKIDLAASTPASEEAPADGAGDDLFGRLEEVVAFFEGHADTLSSSRSKQHAQDIRAVLAALRAREEAPAEGAGEDGAWIWLDGHVECDPADRDYSADEMVDAFMAGQSAALRNRTSEPEAGAK